MVDISRRQWDLIQQRLSKLEGKIRMIENKLELIERRLRPSDLYRIIKQQEQEEAIAPQKTLPKLMP
ncbi:MAG: hypothetical protein K8T10_05755 [Candidatus Eremiobacteraeota bacterium]|nr:hypothetical protein [Candidatus Eremiobacteraeota bacterium]